MAARPAEAGRWAARPRLAMVVRVLVLAVPVGLALAAAVGAAMLLPAPGSLRGQAAWWLVVLATSTAVLVLTDRLARRALPLAVLLELSLVFPDKAPSRARAARTGSVAQLERTVDRLRQQGVDTPAVEAAETLVVLVGVLGLHDKRTRGHSERVRALTDLLTSELGLDEDDRAKIRWAALVHDLGKLRVPVAVLNGGTDLADDEWEALRRHPEEGQRLAGGFVGWLGEWGRTIVEHHERWDGGGYPRGLAGTDISYGARIVAVADSFEVMTASRSYAPARSASAARAELARCAGHQFDPDVVRAFLGISVSRLTWVLGPLTWAVQAPVVATLDRAGQVVKVASVSLLVGGLLSTGWVAGPDVRVSPGAADPLEAATGPSGGRGAGAGVAGGGGTADAGGAGRTSTRTEDAEGAGAAFLGPLPFADAATGGSTLGALLAGSPTEQRRDAAAASRGATAAAPGGGPTAEAAPTTATQPAPPTAAEGAAPGPAPAPAPAAAPVPAPAPAPAQQPSTEPAPSASPATRADVGEPGTPASPATPARPGRP